MTKSIDLSAFKKLLEFIEDNDICDEYSIDENDRWRSDEFNQLIKNAEDELKKS